jgi:uncharacterized membrane protein
MSGSPFASPESRRLPWLDAARGAAVAAMMAYHLCWDLDWLGLANFDLLDNPVWLAARTAIVCAFLAIAGVALALATREGIDRGAVMRRLLRLGTAAAAVSAVSYAMFPDTPIFFGVLHHLAVAGVLGLAFIRLPPPVIALLGVGILALSDPLHHPLFNEPWLLWVGLGTIPPASNDFVPLYPWFGAVLLGIALGRVVPTSTSSISRRQRPGAAAWMGRHSLLLYLVHQPVLFGALTLTIRLFG